MDLDFAQVDFGNLNFIWRIIFEISFIRFLSLGVDNFTGRALGVLSCKVTQVF